MGRVMVGRLLAGVLLVGVLATAAVASAQTGDAVARATATATAGVFDFQAQGFAKEETVSTWFTGPSQQVMAGDYYETDRNGQVSFQKLMPRHLQPGRWAITIHELASGEEAIVYFNVSLRGADATLQVNQASGAVGSTFAFAGTGFGGDETVSYWLTGPDGKAYEGGLVTANGDGRVDFTFTIGAGTQPGRWTMTAYGMESDRLGLIAFTVS